MVHDKTINGIMNATTLIRKKMILRYPGGKSSAIPVISKYIPFGLESMVSTFAGGCSMEIFHAWTGTRVYASDVFEPLVNFWQNALENPAGISHIVRQYYPLDKEKFYELRNDYDDIEDSLERAAIFYVLNQTSYNGVTFSGGFSPGHPNFTQNGIQRLERFECSYLSVDLMDYKDALAAHPDDFVYLDPPYLIDENLYGARLENSQGDFDHSELAEILRSRKGWVMSYNDCEEIRKLYDWAKVYEVSWTYGMSNIKGKNKDRIELVIVSE